MCLLQCFHISPLNESSVSSRLMYSKALFEVGRIFIVTKLSFPMLQVILNLEVSASVAVGEQRYDRWVVCLEITRLNGNSN
jgi:hypothetical protein